MKWSLNELRQVGGQPIEVDETLQLEDALKKRRPDIIGASKAHVHGLFSVDELGVLGYLQVNITLVLPSTRSLEPVTLNLDFDLTEHYISHHEHDLSYFEDTDVVIVLKNDILDLDKVIEDNILLQIPMQVLTTAEKRADFEMPTGRDWNVISESQLKKIQEEKTELDPRFAKLQDFFSENSEE